MSQIRVGLHNARRLCNGKTNAETAKKLKGRKRVKVKKLTFLGTEFEKETGCAGCG
jgi:hypothetical protein